MRTVCFVSIGILLAATVCAAAHVSGTYVAHGPTFTEMLELTETSGGNVSGVLSSVVLKKNGSVSSEQIAVSGTEDAGQIMLSARSVLTFISGKSLAGTYDGSTIQIHLLDSDGSVAVDSFVRSNPEQFKTYANEMKSRGQVIAYNSKLLEIARQYGKTDDEAEEWIASSETHAGKIAAVEANYNKIENQMRTLLGREHRTFSYLSRAQISLKIEQWDLVGERQDTAADYPWDTQLDGDGLGIKKAFDKWDGSCGTAQEFQERGATSENLRIINDACERTVSEKSRFESIYDQITKQRKIMKSFEAAARSRRKALVDEANRSTSTDGDQVNRSSESNQ